MESDFYYHPNISSACKWMEHTNHLLNASFPVTQWEDIIKM